MKTRTERNKERDDDYAADLLALHVELLRVLGPDEAISTGPADGYCIRVVAADGEPREFMTGWLYDVLRRLPDACPADIVGEVLRELDEYGRRAAIALISGIAVDGSEYGCLNADKILAYDVGRKNPASEEIQTCLRQIADKPHRAPLYLRDMVAPIAAALGLVPEVSVSRIIQEISQRKAEERQAVRTIAAYCPRG